MIQTLPGEILLEIVENGLSVNDLSYLCLICKSVYHKLNPKFLEQTQKTLFLSSSEFETLKQTSKRLVL